ncbi:hypothetical protein [Sphingobacterium sp. UBA6645]|uniref:hypothetical protein n=1 Tax=Sphingobacterium sp. UBA6645 TaxID=1947511 RepID=UPI0025EF3786|nr:hypothetical protein [Sphingobacterium sp. UBA6645]
MNTNYTQHYMNQITATRVYSLIQISCYLLITSILFSCTKNDFNGSPGDAEVSVNIGMKYEEEDNKSRALPSQVNSPDNQVIEIPLADGKLLRAELTTVKKNRATTIVPVPTGMVYRVVVYNSNGSYKDQKLFTAGSEASAGNFILDGNTQYTFIAYSLGNERDPGAAPSTALSASTVILSSLTLTNTNNDAWLHVKQTVTTTTGQNNINLILKNKLSQITTTVDASTIGPITEIGAKIGGHYSQLLNIKLDDGSFTPTSTAQSRNFIFSNLGQSKLSSAPLIYYNGSSTPYALVISSLNAGGTRKTDITVDNFILKPGYQYNLTITFVTSGIIVGDLIWAKGNLTYNNGIYSNRNNPEETGYDYKLTDYWNYASPESVLLPAMNTTFQAETPAIQLPLNDPCRLIEGGLWRMPTLADFESLGNPIVVSESGVENSILNGTQPNGTGSSLTNTKDAAGYIYFTGTDTYSGQPAKLKFFAGGGLRGAVTNNIPQSEPDISTFRNFDVIYHASDAQEPNPTGGLYGVPMELRSYLYAPPTFLTLNENSDKRFNFLSQRYVHTELENDDVRPRRDSRFPIRCVKSK